MVRDGRDLVVVEVKTRTTADPATRFDDDKAYALRRALSRMRPRPNRIDLVTVEMGEGAATIVWRKGVL